MRRAWQLFILILLLCSLLCGCDLWMDGYYSSATPHIEANDQPVKETSDIRSYDDLRSSMETLVENGTNSGLFYISGFNEEQVRKNMDWVIRYFHENHAIGSYAVEEITYDLGTHAGRQALSVEITYNRSRYEILRIKRVQKMEDVAAIVETALDNCDSNVVLHVSNYKKIDCIQLVQDYVDANPQTCMELPQVAVGVYPDSGIDRVIEINFTYQTSRDTLRSMQSKVRPVFDSAELYVSGDAEENEKFAQLYSFLMERYTYKIETSITPSYSLLRHGVGDSKAFAVVYSAMCRQAGLECKVVTGTKEGEAWYWNALLIDGTYFYIDLIQCSIDEGYMPKLEEEMLGYVWDYSEFTT